jgi:hypothetical protein
VTSHRKPIARITGLQRAIEGPPNPLQGAIDAGIASWNGRKPVFRPAL